MSNAFLHKILNRNVDEKSRRRRVCLSRKALLRIKASTLEWNETLNVLTNSDLLDRMINVCIY
jgi:hypothetical protein